MEISKKTKKNSRNLYSNKCPFRTDSAAPQQTK